MRAVVISALLMLLAAPVATAQDAKIKVLQTGDDSRGWEAVGRLDLGGRGFCTGALIAEDVVLTAAHCLFDSDGGAIDRGLIQFLAGWRNGRAAAYRGVKNTIVHPDYLSDGRGNIDLVQYDVALLQLDQPIRLPSIRPFDMDGPPQNGDAVGVVSYAQDRSEAPSLERMCHVLRRDDTMLILSCDVDFGASGAPVFSLRDGVARVMSVVSAKAEVDGRKVALGAPLTGPVAILRARLADLQAARPGKVRVLSGGQGGTFVRP